MKGLTRARGLPWQVVRTDRGMSRYLPLIVLGGITVILAQSYLNAGLVSFFDFDRLFDSTLPSTDGKMTGLDLLLSLLVMAAVPRFAKSFSSAVRFSEICSRSGAVLRFLSARSPSD